MKRSFSLYPPAVALVALACGVDLAVSLGAALIVAGVVVLTGWVAYFVFHARSSA